MKHVWQQKHGMHLVYAVCLGTCMGAALSSEAAVHGPEATIELVVLEAASPSDKVPTLPSSLGLLGPGSTFFLEVWTQTAHPNGLSSASVDLAFDSSLVNAVVITHTALFGELQNGSIDNQNGIIDDVSGSHLGPCSDEVGIEPNWARVAIIEMTAVSEGSLTIQSMDTDSLVYGTAICGVGDVDPAAISYGVANLTISGPPIPAVSEWGYVVLTLLFLTGGTIIFGERRSRLSDAA